VCVPKYKLGNISALNENIRFNNLKKETSSLFSADQSTTHGNIFSCVSFLNKDSSQNERKSFIFGHFFLTHLYSLIITQYCMYICNLIILANRFTSTSFCFPTCLIDNLSNWNSFVCKCLLLTLNKLLYYWNISSTLKRHYFSTFCLSWCPSKYRLKSYTKLYNGCLCFWKTELMSAL
jgi:hypothetical protein